MGIKQRIVQTFGSVAEITQQWVFLSFFGFFADNYIFWKLEDF